MNWCVCSVDSMHMLKHSEKRAKHMKSKTIKVDYLARVEGEGGLLVKVSGKKVTDVKFNIFEPPRFFEAFLARKTCTAKHRISLHAFAVFVR